MSINLEMLELDGGALALREQAEVKTFCAASKGDGRLKDLTENFLFRPLRSTSTRGSQPLRGNLHVRSSLSEAASGCWISIRSPRSISTRP
jgi:hypothetical protein